MDKLLGVRVGTSYLELESNIYVQCTAVVKGLRVLRKPPGRMGW